MPEPDAFDGAYGRLAATRLAPGRGPLPDAPPSVLASRLPPRSRLLPRLALMPPRREAPPAWRPPGEATGRHPDALAR